MKLTESKLTALLAQRHCEDVFVSQCKNGASWNNNQLRILDAWALKKTWSPVTTFGYEIKVSRSDFVQDEKWADVLGCCHLLYFVCPPNLIQANELAKEVGLIYASSNGERLYIKKKAARRKIELPIDMLLYILMTRTKITESQYNRALERDNKSYWRAWLAEKEENQKLGYQVSQRIQRLYSKMEVSQHEMEKCMQGYDEIAARLKDMGIDLTKQSVWDAYHKIDSMAGKDVIHHAQALANKLTEFVNELQPHVHTPEQKCVIKLHK